MKQYLFILLILSLQQLILATEPIALISKIRGTVKHKMFSDRKYQTKLTLDAPILSDSQIRTKKNAFPKRDVLFVFSLRCPPRALNT